MVTQDTTERLRRYWDKHSRSYDQEMGFMDRVLFGDTRAWVCSQASGDVLEVAVGTGLNLEHYPPNVRLTGVDWSGEMLTKARRRAADLGRPTDLREGDAQALDFADQSFDTVVCTFSLCAIPDERRALAEMHRVLRPGGRLLLADHVAATAGPARAIQRLLEVVTVPLGGEHFRLRPVQHAAGMGLRVEQQERFKLGIVERVILRKPAAPDQGGAAAP
jgi:ubiquinone/menaquinone biosynthesis C-methylase UbiE